MMASGDISKFYKDENVISKKQKKLAGLMCDFRKD